MSAPKPIAAMLEGCRWARDAVGRGGATIYRFKSKESGPDLFLKYGEDCVAAEINDEHARLNWLAGRIPVPRVLQYCGTADQSWLLTTAVPGKSALDILEDSPGSAPVIVDALANFMRRFHSIPAAECPFDSGHALSLAQARQRIDANLVDLDDFDDERQGWSAEQVWMALQGTMPFQPDAVVTHGDFSLDNIILNNGEVTGCIDVGRAGVADRYQDLAILWNAIGEFGDHLRERLLHSYGIDQPDDRRLQFHLMLDELF